MTAPRTVSRKLIEKKPYVVWNEFVDLLAMSEYRDLSERQRTAHLVFRYWSEVENGGHMQYFENQGTSRLDKTIDALNVLGATSHAKVLAQAANRFRSRRRSRTTSVEKYVETALEGEFDRFDRAYAKCRPQLQEVLGALLARNQADFVLVGEKSDRGILERDAEDERIGRWAQKFIEEH